MLVALAIATVLAEPEADANPDAWYGGYYGYPYSSYGYYGYYPYRHYGHYLGKREAEAVAPAADDKVALHPGIYGLGYATIAANPVVGNPGYALAKSYVPYHHGHFLGKRDAEADAEPQRSRGYYGYGGYGLGYGFGYRGYYGRSYFG